MKKQLKPFLIFLLLIFLSKVFYPQGLQFYSNDKLIAERTSYHVFEQKPESFKDYISLSFQLSILDPLSFGYVFYIEDNVSNLDYNLTYTNENADISYLNLSFKSSNALIRIPLAKSELGRRKWNDFQIIFNATQDSISIIFNEKSYRVSAKITNSKIQPDIYFGKHDSFIDVPEMAIRNLVINGKNETYSFQFNEIAGNEVHDRNGKSYGSVDNPIWLIKESYYWKLIQEFNFESVTAISFDKKYQRFILTNRDSLFMYSPSLNRMEKYKLNKPLPVPLRLGTAFIDNENQYLYVYEVNDVPDSLSTMARIDLNTLDVISCCNDLLNEQRHHHISYFDKTNNKYWIFGGFGNKHYSNELFSFNLGTNNWQNNEFTGDIITPRFFSGATELSNNQLLIFGGVGNPSGDQTLGKIYYTDCYKLDFNKSTIEKLWELTDFKENKVSSRNMIMSTDSTHFYTLYYKEYIPNTSLNLYRFSIDNGSYTILGDSIPMVSERIRTNANLYLNSETNEIYCLTQQFKLDGSSQVKLYSLPNPPVSKKDFYRSKQLPGTKPVIIVLILLSIVLIIVAAIFLIKVLQRKKLALNAQRKKIQTESKSLVKYAEPNKNAVSLFGQFRAYDNKGKNISHLFSPKIKQLFILILLRSDNEKTTSKDIYEAIWPDKPIDKAKNSKGVTLNQLRKILIDIDGIELISDNKYLLFDIKKDFYYDYKVFTEKLNLLAQAESSIDSIIPELKNIVNKGKFLKYIENSYFDKYKGEQEADFFKVLPFLLESSFKNQNYNRVVEIAKVIYKVDITNETAFCYELLALVKIELMEKAKKRYNAFIVDYNKETNDDYPYTFRELIKIKAFEIIKDNTI